MNDYLKTHGCAVLPLVFASYKVDGDLKLLKKDKEYFTTNYGRYY